jgi:superoxide dismutase
MVEVCDRLPVSADEAKGLNLSFLLSNLGHINHSLFWKNLAPASQDGGKLADGPLKKAIEKDFGSVEAFKKEFNTKTAAIQGSGWGWLVSSLPRFVLCRVSYMVWFGTGIQCGH